MRTPGRVIRLGAMDNDREYDYDQDTVGDHDENTLDGSEGLDADVISTDGEDLTVDPPERWKSAEENDTLEDKLAAERPDTGTGDPESTGDPEDPDQREIEDEIDQLDPDGRTRLLGED